MIQIMEKSLLVILAGICAVTDLHSGKIYNFVVVTGLAAGMLLRGWTEGAAGILDILCSAGFSVVALYPFYRARGLGAGDIKLLAAVAAWLPSDRFLRCFAVSFLIGAVWGMIRIACTCVPAVRTGRSLSAGQTAGMIQERIKLHTIHFAVPIAVSVILCVMEVY